MDKRCYPKMLSLVGHSRGSVGKARVAYLISIILLLGLLTVSYLLFAEWSRRFPHLEPGSYMGTISGTVGQEPVPRTQSKLNFYVERSEGSDEYLVVVLHSGWMPQLVSGVPVGSEGQILPLVLKGDGGRFTLTGKQIEPSKFQGKISGPEYKGTWEMIRVPSDSLALDEEALKQLKLWLLLRAELTDIEVKIGDAETVVPAQRREIEKLTAFVTEGERLKTKANEKYLAIQEDLKKAQQAFKVRQDEARKLEETLRISQKLPGIGKLVALSRESLEREGRWIDSMLKSSQNQSPEDLEQALERGEKILALKRVIAAEHAKIEDLTHGAAADELAGVDEEMP